MSRVTSNSVVSDSTPTKRVNNIDELSGDDFLQLMITELQQQDPLNPMENKDLVQQINSIRELSATTELTSTLQAVQTGQNISTASALIGKTVKALDDDAKEVNGKVDSVSVTVDPKDDNKREIRVQVGDKQIKLNNIREIVP